MRKTRRVMIPLSTTNVAGTEGRAITLPAADWEPERAVIGSRPETDPPRGILSTNPKPAEVRPDGAALVAAFKRIVREEASQ